MAYNARVYNILIASPSDVDEERKAIAEVMHNWNAANAKTKGIMLVPIKWETHSYPEMGEEPQNIINSQIVNDCDMVIGVFWCRMGTPTTNTESGTLEEIERLMEAGKPAMIYFCNRSMPHGIDTEQLIKVREFKEKIQDDRLGLYQQYASVTDLEKHLIRHLQQQVDEKFKGIMDNENIIKTSILNDQGVEEFTLTVTGEDETTVLKNEVLKYMYSKGGEQRIYSKAALARTFSENENKMVYIIGLLTKESMLTESLRMGQDTTYGLSEVGVAYVVEKLLKN